MLKKVPKFFKSFYFLTGFPVFLWMLFFAKNDIISTIQSANELNQKKEEKEYYLESTVEARESTERLQQSNEEKERMAREKYYMKKEGEDVFVIQQEESVK